MTRLLMAMAALVVLSTVSAAVHSAAVVQSRSFFDSRQQKIHHARVETHAATAEAARHEGFRLAIEQSIGPAVLSELQAENSRMVTDRVISYSAGMVDRFEIVSQTASPRGVTLVMDVWVAHNNMAQRLLNSATAQGTIDGPRLAAQTDSLAAQRQHGSDLVSAVLRDWPHRSFDLTVAPVRPEITHNGQTVLHVDFSVKWNYQYLLSMWDALSPQSNTPVNCFTVWDSLVHPRGVSPACESRQRQQSFFSVRMKPDSHLTYWNGSLAFDSSAPLTLLYQTVQAQQPAVLIQIDGGWGQTVRQVCMPLTITPAHQEVGPRPTTYMLTNNGQRIVIDQRHQIQGTVTLNMGRNSPDVTRMQGVRATVISRAQCP
jgi:hypothetical protein